MDIVVDEIVFLEIGFLFWDNLSLVEKVIVGVISFIWVLIVFVVLVVSFFVIGFKVFMKKWEYWIKMKEFKKDKCGFLVKVFEEFFSEVVEKKFLRLYVVE